MDMPLLKLEKVTFRYNAKSDPLLKSVDLELLPGERVGIIGDNGSGKSTIAKLLLGLCSPEKGVVKLFGKEAGWGNHYPSLGYIGDPSYSPGGLGLPTDISVRNLVDTFKQLCDDSRQKYDFELENELSLQDFYKTDVAKLSKGQRMRLMAFLALAKRPKVLIADEATEGLDSDSREVVLSAIRRASNRSNFSMIWISHRRYEVALLTEVIYELSNGRLNRVSMDGFDCEIEVESGVNSSSYQNLSRSEALEIMSEIFMNPQVSRFNFLGKKKV